jgi:hypothetical protein
VEVAAAVPGSRFAAAVAACRQRIGAAG